MIALFRSLHTIAARRGDGLRPEFLEMMPRSPARPNASSSIERDYARREILPADASGEALDNIIRDRVTAMNIKRQR